MINFTGKFEEVDDSLLYSVRRRLRDLKCFQSQAAANPRIKDRPQWPFVLLWSAVLQDFCDAFFPVASSW
jgi:hypothetical protein